MLGLIGKTVDDLSNAARKIDRNGLTKAGRALQKHADRPNSVFSYTNKKPDVLNREGQRIVDDILGNPKSVFQKNKFDGVDVISPNGKGVSFYKDGSMRGLLEP